MRIFLLLLAIAGIARAQQKNCALNAIADSTSPTYPPIAKAAHVTGMIIMIATFEQSGKVQNVNVISGPQMLQQPAVDYVKGWVANKYSGIRNCPVVINYVLDKPGFDNNQFARIDTQHVDVFGQTVCLCDPPADLGRKKRFWLF